MFTPTKAIGFAVHSGAFGDIVGYPAILVWRRKCHSLHAGFWDGVRTAVLGALVAIHVQRRVPPSRAMPRANPTKAANPLISGATGIMAERTFAHLERFSRLDLQRAVAANAAGVLDGPYATRQPSGRITGLAR